MLFLVSEGESSTDWFELGKKKEDQFGRLSQIPLDNDYDEMKR